MNKELLDLQLEINYCVHEIHELTQDIKNIDKLVSNPDFNDDEIKDEMDQIIEEYKKVVNKTRILLEAYFHEEVKAGEPADFLFRRLYSKLKDAY